MASETPNAEVIRFCNWSGSIPVMLTLAPTSLGTTSMPHPIFCMLNRATFLHVGLRDAILRLHKFAPATISFSSGMKWTEPGPQDSADYDDDDAKEEETKENSNNDVNNSSSSSTRRMKSHDATKATTLQLPVCWLEDEENQIPLRWHIFAGVLFDMLTSDNPLPMTSPLPWKIRLHFSNYPSSQLLPLEADQVMTAVGRSFKNSLKQALFLQYGNSKVAMNMSKQIHERLWDSIVSSNYKLYQQINSDLQVMEQHSVQLIPVRLYLDSKPPLQRPCRNIDTENTTTTLGSLFMDWMPNLFPKTSAQEGQPTSINNCRWFVGGINPPLTASILELWQNLCHPDHFLYIVVLTR